MSVGHWNIAILRMIICRVFNRPTQIVTLLAAGFGGPYLFFNGSELASSIRSPDSPSTQSNATSQDSNRGQRSPGRLTSGSLNYSSSIDFSDSSSTFTPEQSRTPLVNSSMRDFREFVRFDITPGWVTATFPRVSTVLSNVQMDGLRVPVVTGTSSSDFAGTVDYYFDRQQSLRRIILQGHCGDPTEIVQLLREHYKLMPEPSLGGHLYTIRWNNRVTSLAAIQPAPVIYADDPFRKFSILFELNQPSLEYGMSEQAEEILRNSWQNLRWQ